jgi:hypothetical protein
MRKLILSIGCSLLIHFVFAQKAPIKFGDIQMEDMKMTVYDKDTSAIAVVLVDFGKAFVSVSSIKTTLNFERHIRIKILKKGGLKWADAGIPVFHSGTSEERITNLKASTYNLENGKIVETKMSKDGIFKEKFNRNINLQKFTLPNVKEGAIIEYSYTVISDFLSNFPNWQFQKDIPTRWSEYWAIIPDFFVMERYMQGYVPSSVYEVKDKSQSGYNEKAYHWISKDVPAFKEEPYMTSEGDYISKINFALAYINFPGQPTQEIMGSWAKLNQRLLEDEDFGRAISGSSFLKKAVDDLINNITDERQKTEAIYTYVKNTIEWDGTRDFFAGNLKKVFDTKKGTAGDINLALASMLRKAGLNVDMILLSTRDHGFVRKQYPMSKQFNYTICAVLIEGQTVLLDATEKQLPMGVLPERCLNGEGLMISSTRHGWFEIQPKAKSKTIIDATFAMTNTGELKGKMNFTRDGYDALKMRKSYIAKGEKDYLKDAISGKSWSIEKSEFQNVDEINQPVNEIHDLVIEEHASATGDVIYLNPFVVAQVETNPFKLNEREYPVDFGSPIEKVYMCKISLPQGYVVDEMPQAKVIALPGNAGRYMYNISVLGDNISITSNLQINKNLFVQNEYLNLREFYNQVVAKQAEQIVLKKK